MSLRDHREITPAVRSLVQSAKIEVIPVKGYERKLAEIPKGATVTITCSPKFGLERTLAATELAAATGYHVVPHLAARQVTSQGELKEYVGRLTEAGVSDLFVIGGDAREPGPYTSAVELLDALDGLDHNFTSIGVGCYPEGHPAISDAKLMDALRAKQPAAHYMVSQLCFDAEVLLSWLHRVRQADITLPLHIGLAAPMQVRKLAELSLKIGVGSSLRYLTKQHGLVGTLLRGGAYRPESLLYAMGSELVSPPLQIAGVHMFSFNQVAATVAWQQRAAH